MAGSNAMVTRFDDIAGIERSKLQVPGTCRRLDVVGSSPGICLSSSPQMPKPAMSLL